MLEGCTPWPEEFARRYREQGYWQGITLWQMLERTIARVPDKTAVVHVGGRATYAEFGDKITQLANQLAEQGLRPRERVVLQLPNSLEFLVTFFALLRIGVIPVLALPAHRRAEIGHFIAHAEAVGYFAPDRVRDFDYRAMAAEIAAGAPSLRRIFILGEPGPGQVSLTALLSAPPVEDAEARVQRFAPPSDEVAFMLLSGGTTGLPKLIPRTHDDYVYNCREAGVVAGYQPATIFLALLQMSHNFTLGCPGVCGVFAVGGTVVIAPDPSPETVFPLIEREKVTILAAAMPVVVNWLASDLPERYDLSSLKSFMSGGAKLVTELRKRVEERFKCIYQESLGTGEGLLSYTRLDDPEEIRMTSSGRPISPADEIKVVDESGREVAEGEVGELICRGPYTIRGYYKAPEASFAAFTDDGFYRMGDAVKKIGPNVYYEGRLKDLINRGGEKISCEEVENHLLADPRVKSACVVAMPDPTYGERACAFVIPRGNAKISFEDMKTFLLGRKIAKFKLPERLEVVDEFPTSAAGKILRRELRRIIAEKLAGEQAK